MTGEGKNKPTIWIYVGLVIVTVAVYGQVASHDFINYDDNVYVTENRYVKSGLTVETIQWAFTTERTGNWHPLTWISLLSDFTLFGLNPTGYHLTNLLLHAANSLLLFVVLRRMTKALWQSAFVAAVFALHPLHVESVAWVAERKDVLSTLFWMLAMLGYVRYVDRPGIKRYLLVIFFFIIGLMAKPMLVTLPFVLLLLDYWPLERFKSGAEVGWPRASKDQLKSRHTWSSALSLCQEKIPMFALAVASSVVTFLAQQRGGAVSELSTLPLAIRISNAIVAYAEYIGKTILPFNLSIFYPHTLTALPLMHVAGAGALLLAISGIVVWRARRQPYLLVGWFWYLGTLVPVIGIVQVGLQSMADRYTYIPLIGLSMMLAWWAPDLLGQRGVRRTIVALPCAAVLLLLMISTQTQVGYWKNSMMVFSHATKVTENNYVAHTHLGDALSKEGKDAEALVHYAEAVRIKSDFADAHNNLGAFLEKQGRLQEAVTHYTEALRLKPNFAKFHYNLGAVLGKQGQLEAGATHLSDALKIDPEDLDAHNNLAIVLALQGKNIEAISHFREVIRGSPGNAAAYFNLGIVLTKERRFDEAIANFSQALYLRPNYAEAQAELERVIQTRQPNK